MIFHGTLVCQNTVVWNHWAPVICFISVFQVIIISSVCCDALGHIQKSNWILQSSRYSSPCIEHLSNTDNGATWFHAVLLKWSTKNR